MPTPSLRYNVSRRGSLIGASAVPGTSGTVHAIDVVPDEIKLDMELVRDIDSDRRRQAIVRAVVQMCDNLDTLLIAEGIETREEAATLSTSVSGIIKAFGTLGPPMNGFPQ